MRPDILTSQGRYFDFMRPDDCVFTIIEIAHALSHICRFTGHTRHFYSVAQHSVLVSRVVPDEDALAGLLHDAAEAFIGDVAKPLKKLLPDYAVIEARVERAVLGRFGLSETLPNSVKHADLVLLATEKRDLMPATGDSWSGMANVEALPERIVPVSAVEARLMFINRFLQLTSVNTGI